MILILSNNFEPSTDMVTEWLVAMGKKFVRINFDTDYVTSVDFKLSDKEIDNENLSEFFIDDFVERFVISLKDGRTLDLRDIDSVWYRRGGFPEYYMSGSDLELYPNPTIDKVIKEHLRKEYDNIVKIVNFYLFRSKRIKTLNSPFNSSPNKLMNLIYARNFGLKTPSYQILSNKDELSRLINKEENYISKAINEMVMGGDERERLVSYTEIVNKEDLVKIDDFFFPSCVQNQVVKKADIRTVYLDGTFYSIAIFSQSNSRTTVDFRKYDEFNPNRSVPFQLPQVIEKKLKNLLMFLNYNFCSIDLIWDQNDLFYFLEINPVGQFGMVSNPGNYLLEKKIAELL